MCSSGAGQAPGRRTRYLDWPRPFGIAHRGGYLGGPENTVAAFRAAVDLGYRFLETDVHCTIDGVLVAFHDSDLSRLAGENSSIGELSWEAIDAIELDGGHRIPRLVDLLDAFPEHRFNIDPKSDEAVGPLIALIRERQDLDRIGIGSFSDDRISRMQKELGPELSTSPGPNGVLVVVLAALLGLPWKSPYTCVQIPWKVYGIRTGRRWIIARLQRVGLQVHFWTVNELDEMNRLLDAGADAIISDAIDVLAEVLHRRSG